jgi:hypothetical protein
VAGDARVVDDNGEGVRLRVRDGIELEQQEVQPKRFGRRVREEHRGAVARRELLSQ